MVEVRQTKKNDKTGYQEFSLYAMELICYYIFQIIVCYINYTSSLHIVNCFYYKYMLIQIGSQKRVYDNMTACSLLYSYTASLMGGSTSVHTGYDENNSITASLRACLKIGSYFTSLTYHWFIYLMIHITLNVHPVYSHMFFHIKKYKFWEYFKKYSHVIYKYYYYI